MASTTAIAAQSNGTPNWPLLDGSVTEEEGEFSHSGEVPNDLVPVSIPEITTVEKVGMSTDVETSTDDLPKLPKEGSETPIDADNQQQDAKTYPLGSVGLSPSDHENGGGGNKEVQMKETSASSGKLASPANLEQTALPKVARSYARCSKRANVSGEGVIIRDSSKARSSTTLDSGAPNKNSKDPEVEDFYPEPVKLDPVSSRQYIQLHANGKKVIGMPDTGATVNFMSTNMYQREFSHLPLRQKSMHQIMGVTNTNT